MKKLLVFLIALLPFVVSAQEKQSVVTLKNGAELKGAIKSIDPTDALTIVIAGVETTIKMADIAKVEGESSNNTPEEKSQATKLRDDVKLVVTDKADYPEAFEIKVRGYVIKMILVRGGDMNMGYNGDGSIGMDSEPIHPVGVTSFYISDSFVPIKLAKQFKYNSVQNVLDKYYWGSWKKCNELAQKISKEVGISLRLPYEAEWEFAACSDKQSTIFSHCKDEEYCKDIFAKYPNTPYTVDPLGPPYGDKHVVRHYGKNNKKFERDDDSRTCHYMRLAIKAKDLKL